MKGVHVIDALPGDELSLAVLARVAERHAQRDIRITCDPKPMPDRSWDWSAIEPSNYEAGMPQGFGATAEAALIDLLDQIEGSTYYCDLERYAGDPQTALSWTERDIEGRA